MSGIEKFRAILKRTGAELVMAALVAGMVYLIVQLFSQRAILQEISPDPGMTKNCTQDSDGVVVCSQAPAAPAAPPAAAPDPDAPLYVTVTATE